MLRHVLISTLPGIFMFLVLSGCQTKVNEDWQGFGSIHPFPQPYVDNHKTYLRNNGFQLDICQTCHGTNFNTVINGTSCVTCHTHIGGPGACNTCHGNFNSDPTVASNQAPPVDVNRDSATTSVGVGAHQTHLTEGLWTDAFNCNECHSIPSSWSTPTHIDSLPAELTWGTLATHDDYAPQWNDADTTCSNTYCHLAASPKWTLVDGSQAACGTCHSLPPPAPHPASTACQICHGQVVDADYNIIDKSKHVNGVVDVSSEGHPFGEPYVENHPAYLRNNLFPLALCKTCHGSDYNGGTSGVSCLGCHTNTNGPEACLTCHGNFNGNPNLPSNQAPPVDIARNSTTTEVTVGAHQAHLTEGLYTDAFNCNECHVVPTGISSTGHLDASPSEMTWGALATNDQHNPQWNRIDAICSNTYCHLIAAPVWNQVNGTQAACGTCHSLPPPAPHPASSSCYLCHGTVVDSTQTIINKSLHVNGTVDFQIQHPFGQPYVVNHSGYLRDNLFPLALCKTCHGSDYSGGTSGVSCLGCHTNTNGPEACLTCHGNFSGNPTLPYHQAPPVDIARNSSTSVITVGAHQAHLTEGPYTDAFACTECHIVPTGINSAGHIDASPTEMTWGTLATHDGYNPQWNRASATCNDVYCHMVANPIWNQVGSGQAACGTCHNLPPPPPHVTSSACYVCHGAVVDSNMNIIDKSRHVDGIVDEEFQHPFGEPYVTNHTGYLRANLYPLELCQQCHGTNYGGGISGESCLGCHVYPGGPEACNTCHGNFNGDPTLPVNIAPPKDVVGNISTDSIGVGAHHSHIVGRVYTDGVDCDVCHVIPTAWNSPGHIDPPPAEVIFSGLANQGGAHSQWVRTSESCNSTYCHYSGVPVWTIVNGTQAACGTCHSIPPPPPHENETDCYDCHGMVINSAGVIYRLDLHVNGIINVDE